MAALDVVLLTDERYERPDPASPFVRQMLHEETLVADALRALGLRVERVAWSNARFDFASTRAALFRSTWDYAARFAEFSRWLAAVEPRTRLVNPAPLVRWNADKRYLLDLEARGVAIVPTRLLPAGAAVSLAERLDAEGWSEAVVKPAVSASARETWRVERARVADAQSHVDRLLPREALLLQPFRREVVDDGELSLVVLGGRFSHAARKVARRGDFRVQDDHGGSAAPHAATAAEIAFAERAVLAAAVWTPTSRPPLYARVDAIRTTKGPMLMELELIEPELFFRFEPRAADELARLVAAELQGAARAT